MAKFFNPKEDIIDLQVTSYGKHALSKGEFVPKYYAFFDDDILYDSQWASSSYGEQQNEIKDRLINETPRIKVTPALSGVETSIKKSVEMVKHGLAEVGAKQIQPAKDKHFALPMPLGTTALGSNTLPAWDFYLLKGEISDSTSYYSGSEAAPHIKIPQINAEITYTVKPFTSEQIVPLGESEAKALATGIEGSLSSDADTVGVWGGLVEDFVDGSKLKVYKDSLIIELNEENTDYLADNFDIEVYEVQQVTGSSYPGDNGVQILEELVPLYFARGKRSDLGVSYLSDEHFDLDELLSDPDSNYVEYFLEINVDNEIDSSVVCAHLPSEKSRRKNLLREVDCTRSEGITMVDAGMGAYRDSIDVDPEDCD